MFSKITDFIKAKLGSGGNGSAEGDDGHEHHHAHIDTHYDMLYLTHDAHENLIRAAYIALVRKYHPDRNLTNPEAVAMMQLVNVAYQYLSNPEKKSEHDAWIARQKPQAKVPVINIPDPQMAKLKADAAVWEELKVKAEKEAEKAKERAALALAQAVAAEGQAKWEAAAKQAQADAKIAEDRAIEAARAAKAALDKTIISPVLQTNAAATPYAALKVIPRAPAEVIECAYKTLSQEYSEHDKKNLPASIDALRVIEGAYAVLSDPVRKAAYDATLEKKAPKKKTAQPLSKARVPTPREKEAQEKSDRAASLAKAAAMMAERTAQEEKSLQEQAAQAAKTAAEKAQGADAEKWKIWAKKLADDLQAAKTRAQKARDDEKEAKAKAAEALAAAALEKEWAEKASAADAEAAAKKRAQREAAEQSEQGN